MIVIELNAESDPINIEGESFKPVVVLNDNEVPLVYVPGMRGAQGWTPILAVVEDGLRRVHQVVDWTGSTGTKPVTGLYVGATGLVANIADAKDIRGAQGETGIAADEDFTTIAAFRFMYNY
jgi:hypothetical protein